MLIIPEMNRVLQKPVKISQILGRGRKRRGLRGW